MKHFKTISEFHEFRNLLAPRHPLISVIDVGKVKHLRNNEPMSLIADYYSISVKRVSNMKAKYGQQPFDFNEGIMFFTAPGQVTNIAPVNEKEEIIQTGWVLLIHPDFLWNTPLARIIKRYDFWGYALNEALFLSEEEEATINDIIQNIQREYDTNIDKFSKQIIISQLETLLNYSERFYNRQFITREKSNHQILDSLEKLLEDYFNSDEPVNKGLLTVQYIAEQLHISSKYLNRLLQIWTGQSTQQHIHNKLIEKAKEKLSVTELSVSEIAYGLGFEHLQSFSKLFKSKTKQTPMEFRSSFHPDNKPDKRNQGS